MVKKLLLLLLLLISPVISEAATITVCASGCNQTNLQTAINAANPGDIILLKAGEVYVGEFVLRANSGADITLRTGLSVTGSLLSDSDFPSSGIRITPAYDSVLARLQPNANNAPALRAVEPGEVGAGCASAPCKANGWVIERVKLIPHSYRGSELLRLGSNQSVAASANGDTQNLRTEIPTGFILRHVWIAGDPIDGQHRGAAIYANDVEIRDSRIDNIKSLSEGQALYFNNSEGPFVIENNYLEANGENVIFGGDTPKVANTQTVSASTTTTVTLDAVTNLNVGQGLSCLVGGLKQLRTVSAINSNVVTVSTAFTSAPDVSGTCNWGVVLKNLTFRYNHLYKPPTWRNAIVDTPQNVSAVGSLTGGSLATGNYYYRVIARQVMANNVVARSAASLEVVGNVASGSTGSVTISWAAVPNADSYYIYGRGSGGQNVRFSVNAPTVTFTDTGAAGTTENVPTTSGSKYLVKNSLEFKHIDTALVEGNVIEYSWKDGQDGPCVLFTVANTGDGNDSTIVKDVTFRYNLVRHCAQAIQLTGHDHSSNVQASQRVQGINITHNIFDDINSSWGVSTHTILITSPGHSSISPREGPKDVTIDHNTFLNTGSARALLVDLGRNGVDYTVENFLFTNNFIRRGNYGITYSKSPGGFQAEGNTSWLLAVSGSSSFASNAIVGASCGIYPANNYCPSESVFQAQFSDYAAGNYKLATTSIYLQSATDGTQIGADVDLVTTKTTIALTGNNSGGSTPPPSPPSIITISLSGGLSGQTYSQCFSASGGLAPYVWSVSGSLPTGLSLVDDCIVGTPTSVGTFPFQVTVTDDNDLTAVRDFSVVISEIIYPERRPDAYNGIFQRGTFARETCPDGTLEEIKKGDLCFDLTNSIWKFASATSPTVTWSNLDTAGSSSLSPQTITFVAGSTQHTNVATAGEEFPGANRHRVRPNLVSYTQCALTVYVSTTTLSATSDLLIRYWDGSAWQNTGISIVIGSSSGFKEGAYQTLAVGARADLIVLQPYIDEGTGDATGDVTISNIHLTCKQ